MDCLTQQSKEQIYVLTVMQLSDLVRDILWTLTGESDRFYMTGFYLVRRFEDEIDSLSPSKKLELVKGICDRIELKLMEVAK